MSRIPQWGCKLTLIIFAAGIWPTHAQPITIEGIARSASLFSAIQAVCTEFYAINPDAVRRYYQAYVETGINTIGRDDFRTILEREMERRNKEVEVTGRAQWCAYQRANQEQLGVKDVFVPTGKTSSPSSKIECTVRDLTGTPLNVRRRPNGPIVGALHNGAAVVISELTTDAGGRQWAKIAPLNQGNSGWVFRRYLACSG